MDIDTHNDLETKSGIPLDAVVTHAEMMRAFDAFKETNDQRWNKMAYTAKPYALFYTTKRSRDVQDFDAIKLMKFAVPQS